LSCERLVPDVAEIDDREPPKTERRALAGVRAVAVRSAMIEAARHCLDRGELRWPSRRDDPADPAHGAESTPAIVPGVRRIRRVIWRGLLALARAVGPQTEMLVWFEGETLRREGVRWALRWNGMLANAYARDRVRRRRYRSVGEAELAQRRKSDTVFVFGSGYSLNDITPVEWDEIARHDVIGFNGFFRQSWIPVDFHIFRSALYGELRWRPYAEDIREGLTDNAFYAHTTYVLQEGFVAQHGNQLVGSGVIPDGSPLIRYRSVGGWGLPTRSISEGLRHVVGTLNDSVNLAFCLGWKEIVLVGVDLYDSRYFWLPPDQTISIDPVTARLLSAEVSIAGQRFDQAHNTARNGIVPCMAEWKEFLAREGTRLSVYNPRSLLTEVMPVYDASGAERIGSV
jgi:hypothetical protein